MDRLKANRLGAIQKVASGGQGVVFTAPAVSMPYASALVYKEYKSTIRPSLCVSALDAMPSYLESLPFSEGMELLSRAAWPCRLVADDSGAVTGFVMPAISAEFFIDMTKISGVARVPAEFQHLLNDETFLARRGIGLTDRLRYQLLGELAHALVILHRHGICVGDLSPKNLLFAFTPRPRVYFIDCDAMRLQGRSVATQLETPGWDVHSIHPGEELATPATDAYKLGLLALRILAGDQSTRDANRLPDSVSGEVRRLIRAALDANPAHRPTADTWLRPLATAAAIADTTPPRAAAAPAVPAPTPIRSAPQVTINLPTQPLHPSSVHPVAAAPPARKPFWTKGRWIALACGVVAAVFLLTSVLSSGKGGDGSATSSAFTSADANRSAQTSYVPTVSVLPPGFTSGPDIYGTNCDGGYHLMHHSGWATHSVRGSAETSCTFADNVLAAYWDQYAEPSRSSRIVYAMGALSCQKVPGAQCSGDKFVMTCSAEGGADWITCVGGRNARVYLY